MQRSADDPEDQCIDLHNLICVTLDYIILPLRKSLQAASLLHDVLQTELNDAENKTYEYIARQISVICKANILEADKILRKFPRSQTCFQCLGIDEFTIQGLICIRGLSFLGLFDMPDEDVANLLRHYRDSNANIVKVLSGITKIRLNMELIEKDVPFCDDTRELFSLMHSRLEQDESGMQLDQLKNRLQVERQRYSNPDDYLHKARKQQHQVNQNKRPPPILLPNGFGGLTVPVSRSPGFDVTPPQSPATKRGNNYLKFPSTPKFMAPFNLKRSKSHDVNLATKVKNAIAVASSSKGNNMDEVCSPDVTTAQRSYHNVFFSPVGSSSNQMMADDQANFLRRASIENGLVSDGAAASSNSVQVRTRSGNMHKFELESRIGYLLGRGIMCSVCGSRISFKFQQCAHCKIKVHKHCMQESGRFSCNPARQRLVVQPPFDPHANPGKNNQQQQHLVFPMGEANIGASSSVPGTPHPATLTLGQQPVVSMLVNNTNTNSSSGGSSAAGGPGQSPAPHLLPCSPSVDETAHLKPCHLHNGTRPTQSKFDFEFNTVEVSVPTLRNVPVVGVLGKTLAGPDQETGIQRLESIDSQDETSGLNRTNSLLNTLKEWDIPMESVTFNEVIGRGTFGVVYRGIWHGEVAMKRLDSAHEEDSETENARVAAFRREVAILHKVRHGNLCLFLGACMKPPQFAIVTSLSKGETLYSQLHQRSISMFGNRSINIASQIASGMGYLHAKNILHKDLKSRNIFIEHNQRAVISDYSLFNFVRLCRNRGTQSTYLNVPPQWFCSVAPEILRSLSIHHARANEATELPFTIYSDVYAFGTIWYELLTNEFPYKGLPAETTLYLCGKGLKQSMQIPGPKDFREFLHHCWAYEPRRRPEFSAIVHELDKMPKLHRSPSYPAKPTTAVMVNPRGNN